jgi:hypothetical protein
MPGMSGAKRQPDSRGGPAALPAERADHVAPAGAGSPKTAATPAGAALPGASSSAPVRPETAKPPTSAPSTKRGFWGRLVDLLGTGNQAERTKRRRLRVIAREVGRDRAGYYKPVGDMAGAGLGKLFHTFYRTLGPAQTLLEAAGASETLRTMVIESCLSPEELEVRLALTPEGIAQSAQSLDARRFADKVRRDLARFGAIFDRTRMSLVNTRMRDFWALLDLISFDYYSVLKKFDAAFPRGDFAYNAACTPIDSGLVSTPLKDFLEILQGVDPQADWDGLFDILREYRRVDPVPRDAWRKLLQFLNRLGHGGVLMNIVRLIDRDPDAAVAPREYLRRSAEEYVEKTRVQAEMAYQREISQKRSALVDEMVKKVFGKLPEPRMQFYTAAANTAFQRRGAVGYTHPVPVNYLRIYLEDFFENEVKSVVDFIQVKGRWNGAVPHTISENLQTALSIREELRELDASLDEDNPRGQKVKLAMTKASRNKKEAYILRQVLRQVNDTAHTLLTSGTQVLVALGKALKGFIDDIASPAPRILTNWKELDLQWERQLRSRMVAYYTRLYHLVQLLNQFRDAPKDD